MLLWHLMTDSYSISEHRLLTLYFMLKSFRWDSPQYSVYPNLLQQVA